MSDNLDDPQPVDPGLVRYLRLLVTVLSITMIAGFLVLMVLFVTRFSGPSSDSAPLALPDRVALPEGVEASAFTQGDDWFAIVTTDQRILIYDRASGQLRQTVTLSN